jgi:Uma2 family endonuclease
MEPPIPSRRLYTVAEYLDLDASADARHEFRDGAVIAMAGAEPDHTRIVRNTSRRLDERLEGSGCESFMPDQRVQTDRTRYAYPDLCVACQPFEYLPDVHPRTLVNPRVIVEVLSPSPELVDRGEKFFRYMNISSLAEYVLVAQDRPRAETFVRDPPGMWRLAGWVEGLEATLHIRTFGFEIPLTQIYAGVAFPAAPAAEPER